MRPSTLAPYFAVTFILTILVTSGPLIQGYSTGQDNSEAIAGGSADVKLVKPPSADEVSLEKGAYGSERYILRAPSVTVDVANVTGRPILTYKVEATELGFSRSEYTVLGPNKAGQHEITFSEETFAPSRVTNESYVVELHVKLRASGTRTLFSENVTVPVGR